MKATNRKELSHLLVKHYECFNTQRFYIDAFDESDGTLIIQSSSIQDTCPLSLCKNIAKFCKKHINAENFKFIHVAAWFFKTETL